MARRRRKGALDRWAARSLKERKERQKRLAIARQRAEAQDHTDRVQRRNQELDEMLMRRPRDLLSRRDDVRELFTSGEVGAVNELVEHLLASGPRPRRFPRACQVRYRAPTREVRIAYELPGRDMIPPTRGSKYIQSRNAVEERKCKPGELEQAHRRVIARTMLRALADLFDVTPPELVQSAGVNGYITGIDPSSGRPHDFVMASVNATRQAFEEVVLMASGLDPVACLLRFDTRISSRPYTFEPIVPVVHFDPATSSGEGIGAITTTGPRLNLLAIRDREFEHVVRKLFAAMDTHAVMTPATGDRGVDVIAIAENEITRIRYLIEAKQYRHIVPPKEVRSLHGAMTKTNAHQGVLVTTAWFGPGSYEHADGSRIELIDGKRLRYLLAKFCQQDTIIPLPTLPPDWSPHDIT